MAESPILYGEVHGPFCHFDDPERAGWLEMIEDGLRLTGADKNQFDRELHEAMVGTPYVLSALRKQIKNRLAREQRELLAQCRQGKTPTNTSNLDDEVTILFHNPSGQEPTEAELAYIAEVAEETRQLERQRRRAERLKQMSIPSMCPDDILRTLGKLGVVNVRQSGSSHIRLRKGDDHSVLAWHSTREYARPEISNILSQLNIPEDDFKSALWD